MGRKTQPRSNYRQDAIVIRRTIDAVSVDTEACERWKKLVTHHLHEAMSLLLQRDGVTVDRPLEDKQLTAFLGNKP